MTEEMALVQVVRGAGEPTVFPLEDLQVAGALVEATDAQVLEAVGRALDQPGEFSTMTVTRSSKGIVISEAAVYG